MKRRTLLTAASAALSASLVMPKVTLAQQTQTPSAVATESVHDLPTIEAQLGFAPNAAPPTGRDYPAKVLVKLQVEEKVMQLMDEVEFKYWTFNGTAPGPFIRVREGDHVEIQLTNPADSKLPHSLDLHAVTGPGGGATASLTAPGRISTFAFQALKPGLYLYHCAAMPMAVHIGKGMFGLMLVEPKEGLAAVDKEFYIVQSEFYTRGAFGEPGLQAFDMNKAIDERADYVVFNGHVGAIAGDNALKAKVGDKVRFYLGNAGPNLMSSLHIVGSIFDQVRVEGGSLLNHNVQTTMIPAGGATIAETTFLVPGSYTILDHAIFRAMHKGTLGQLIVEGEENKTLYSGKISDTAITP